MTRKITDIRPVGIAPHLHLIADVKEDDSLLSYSVEIDELTADELIAYAVADPAHILNAHEDDIAELTAGVYMQCDPRTERERALDEWQAESYATREGDYPR